MLTLAAVAAPCVWFQPMSLHQMDDTTPVIECASAGNIPAEYAVAIHGCAINTI